MLVIDLKLALFLLLLLLAGLVALVWVLTRRHLLNDTGQWAVWQSFPLGILLLSSSNRLKFVNRSAYRLLGVKEADVVTTPTLSMAEVAVYATILQNIEQHPGVHQFSLSPSPEIILDVWLGAFSVFRLVLLRDVSQQRQREIEMHLYWSSVAHELRTPLTSILSHLEVSRSENVPADVQTHSLEIVHQQTHRLNNLINSTLDLGRLKSTTHLPKHSLDMILLAEEAIAELILLAEVKGVGLNFNFEPPIPPVLGNPDKLKQLMLNVLDNAIKYCQAGDTVTVLLTSTPEQVVCQITDTGAGIPAQHLPHLTQQFYRGRRDEPGSGLGLAIVEEIVRQHNGRLSITSHTEGAEKGTAVTFSLPILPHFTLPQ